MKRPNAATVALAVGALGSAAANTAWTWQAGPVRVVAGCFTTALVPVAMHLWPRVPVTGWPTRVLRGLVMTYICAAAAVVNLAHAVLLLTDARSERAEIMVLAVLSITAIEALMVMASLARRTRPAGASATEDVQQDAGRRTSYRSPASPAPVSAEEPGKNLLGTVPSFPVLPSYAGQTPETVTQDAAQGNDQDAQDGVGQDAQDEAANTETDPVQWAAVELQAGRSAGYVVLGRRFPDLSERQAKDAARKARTEQDAGLHVVGTGQDRTG